MIWFFKQKNDVYLAVELLEELDDESLQQLIWLFGNASLINEQQLDGFFIGPRKEMITPWSTNAVEITKNMGIDGIQRIESFRKAEETSTDFDPMLENLYHHLDQNLFTLDIQPEPVRPVEDIAAYNEQEGLALNPAEVAYLESLREKLGRPLTDSEIFGFSQVNSEHCRHKIFNGIFEIDGKEMTESLFGLIKNTTLKNRNQVISAYKDNCAFLQGPIARQFAPLRQDIPAFFTTESFESVISLKAETHNFPTTVEPFNGAATGTGGEIRDRIAGGKAAFPVAGTAVYMTSYPRPENKRDWEQKIKARPWLYQSPDQILVKASNGASDFGNKFGQPLICGSVLTFEYQDNDEVMGYDKVIMMAGGIGYGKKIDSLKAIPEKGDQVVLMGGDNYRIGMGGGAVSSVATGQYNKSLELNAVQRSNPEMQKRVYNAIRALGESKENPVISIHDHGAGGHLNCLSELVEETGGKIDMEKLPVGDPTLSAKEIVGNESQERMGLVMHQKDLELIEKIAERERAPLYIIGEATGDQQFTFINNRNGEKPIDLQLADMFGNPPETIMVDHTLNKKYAPLSYQQDQLAEYIKNVLKIEAVSCKDYLTNKVDRSVTGRIAKQQCAGEIQLPLNNLGVIAIDHHGPAGIATSIGHAPVAGLIDAGQGVILSITEALSNLIWAPLKDGLKSVSLSANWMWPCRNEGEDARLYEAVKAASDFCIELGINIPTGKDSLSMTQRYSDGKKVKAPGTVIISATGEVANINQVIEPVVQHVPGSQIIYLPLGEASFALGGSSFAQSLAQIGDEAPGKINPDYLKKVLTTIQAMIKKEKILSGHDVSAGGLITSLLEMNFANQEGGMHINLDEMGTPDTTAKLFSEQPALIIQINENEVINELQAQNIHYFNIGEYQAERSLILTDGQYKQSLDINEMRDVWYETSAFLDSKQTKGELSLERKNHFKTQALSYRFHPAFTGKMADYQCDPERKTQTGIKTAIIREKGINGDREMAWAMHLAGMDVKDVHMTDLIAGRETLEDINMIVFVGGFSNSDVLGSAKGWAGAFMYNPAAKKALDQFYARKDTLSLGICNGCQLMVELGLVRGKNKEQPKMQHNDSHKFESAFLNVDIPQSPSVMLASLQNTKLGIWIAHGEGKFNLPGGPEAYHVALKYSYKHYPGNPNGSEGSTAGICSEDGRHLAMMPHLERAIYPWNWAHYPNERKKDEISPWIEAFINAKKWIQSKK